MTILSPALVFLPYTPRADADARGYEDWLRGVDNPFFNHQPGVVHYSNWKVAGSNRSFSHFDFMYLDPTPASGVWSDPTVIDFANGWTQQWGPAPDAADPSVNYHSYRLRLVDGRNEFDREGVLLGGSTFADNRFGGSVWEVEESMVGHSPLPFYEIAFGSPGASGDAIVGSLIAAPPD